MMRKGDLLLIARLAAVVVNDDHAGRELGTTAGNETLRNLTPRRHEMLATAAALGFALTATVRMVDRDSSPHRGRSGECRASDCVRLAERLLVVVTVADFANRGAAVRMQQAKFARRHLQRGHVLNRHELEARAGGTRDLGAATGNELHTVHERRRRNDSEREVISDVEVVRRGLVEAKILSPTFSPFGARM